MSGRVVADVDALGGVPGALGPSLDSLVRAGLELDAALEWYWARCPDFRPRWQRLGPDLGGHASRCRQLDSQFGQVAGQLARAGAVAPLELIWRRPEDAMASLAAADAAALDRMRRQERADVLVPRVAGTQEQELAAGLSVSFVSVGTSLLLRIVQLADGQVEVTLMDRRDVELSVGRGATGEVGGGGRRVELGLEASAAGLLAEGQGWTKRFPDRAAADAFIDSGRVRALVETAAVNGALVVAAFAGLGVLASGLARRLSDRGFEDPTRTTELVEGGISLGLGAHGPGLDASGEVGAHAQMTVTTDDEAGTRTDTVLVGLSATSGFGGLVSALAPEDVARLVNAGASGEAAVAVTRDSAGRALEFRMTTVTSTDGGETLERTVRSLDVAAPSRAELADALSTDSSSPTARAGEMVSGALLVGTGLGTKHAWDTVVRERYERQATDGPNLEFDLSVGPSASVATETYAVTSRVVE